MLKTQGYNPGDYTARRYGCKSGNEQDIGSVNIDLSVGRVDTEKRIAKLINLISQGNI